MRLSLLADFAPSYEILWNSDNLLLGYDPRTSNHHLECKMFNFGHQILHSYCPNVSLTYKISLKSDDISLKYGNINVLSRWRSCAILDFHILKIFTFDHCYSQILHFHTRDLRSFVIRFDFESYVRFVIRFVMIVRFEIFKSSALSIVIRKETIGGG